MVLLHALRCARYVARGRFMPGPQKDMFDETTTHVFAGYRMIDLFMHVNNAKYLELFEFARWHEGGVKGAYSRFKRAGMYPVVAAAHIQFLKEVPGASLVMIRSRAVSVEDRSFVVRQHMFNRTGTTLHATALFRLSLIDTRGAKPSTLSADEAVARLGYDPKTVRAEIEKAWLEDVAGVEDAAPARVVGSSGSDEGGQTPPPSTAGAGGPEKENDMPLAESALRIIRDVNDMDTQWRRVLRRLQERLRLRRKTISSEKHDK